MTTSRKILGKLSLKKQSLRRLDSADLAGVGGGFTNNSLAQRAAEYYQLYPTNVGLTNLTGTNTKADTMGR